MNKKLVKPIKFFVTIFLAVIAVQLCMSDHTSAQTIPATSGGCSFSQTGATTTSGVSGGTNTYRTYVVVASGAQNAKGGKVDATCYMPSSSSGSAVQIVNGRALGPHVGGSITAPGTCVTYTPEPGYGKQCSSSGNEVVFQDDGAAIFVNSSLRHCVGVSSFCSSNVYSRGHQNTSYKVSGSTVTTNTSGNAIKGAGLFDYSIVSLAGSNTSTTSIGSIPVRFVVHNTWDGNYEAKYLLTIRFYQATAYSNYSNYSNYSGNYSGNYSNYSNYSGNYSGNYSNYSNYSGNYSNPSTPPTFQYNIRRYNANSNSLFPSGTPSFELADNSTFSTVIVNTSTNPSTGTVNDVPIAYYRIPETIGTTRLRKIYACFPTLFAQTLPTSMNDASANCVQEIDVTDSDLSDADNVYTAQFLKNTQHQAQYYIYYETPPVPVTCTLSASPATVLPGGSSMLTWTTTGTPTGAVINQGIGSVNTGGGTRNVGPISTTTNYVLTVSKSGVPDFDCPATVTVTAPVRRLGPWDSIINLPPIL